MKINKIWENLRGVKGIDKMIFEHSELDLGITMEEFDKSESEWRMIVVKLSEKLTGFKMASSIKKALSKRLEFIFDKRRFIYSQYDKARDNGVPFADRKNIIARVDVLAEMEKETRSYFGRKVRPIAEWITPGDVRSIIKDGVDRFFEINYKLAVYD